MIKELVESNGKTGSRAVATPISEFGTDERDDEMTLDHAQTKMFRSLAGTLLWIARCRDQISLSRCTDLPDERMHRERKTGD
jgi:hypothetical protein